MGWTHCPRHLSSCRRGRRTDPSLHAPLLSSPRFFDQKALVASMLPLFQCRQRRQLHRLLLDRRVLSLLLAALVLHHGDESIKEEHNTMATHQSVTGFAMQVIQIEATMNEKQQNKKQLLNRNVKNCRHFYTTFRSQGHRTKDDEPKTGTIQSELAVRFEVTCVLSCRV